MNKMLLQAVTKRNQNYNIEKRKPGTEEYL